MNESNRWVEQLMAEDYLYTNKDFIVSAINVFTGTLFGIDVELSEVSWKVTTLSGSALAWNLSSFG